MGVGDEGGQFVALFFRQGEGVHRVDLVADDAGGGAEQLDKGAVFTVQVTEKIFCALGQAQNGAHVHNGPDGRLHIGIALSEQLQIVQILLFGRHWL